MRFYIDDYRSIGTDDFEGLATLVREDGEEIKIAFFYNTAKIPFDINLREKYKIRIGNTEILAEYRYIVHTKRFEEENRYDGPLGVKYSKEVTEFYLWAPTAYSVRVAFANGNICNMIQIGNGAYFAEVLGDIEGWGYKYQVEHERVYEALDPNAISSAMNSQYNYVIDREKIRKTVTKTDIKSKRQAVIYETSVRDFTCDKTIAFKYPGKYKGMTERGLRDKYGNSVGFDYLCELGITHLQLMPIYDFGSIDESDESIAYNWGYDPVQYNVMEGKYSCLPNDPYERINEVVELVNGYADAGIGVNMDVVYNHVYDLDTFSYQSIVPYYFFRYANGKVGDASFCGNEVASQRYMVRRYIVDSLVYLTKTFGFSGYRFDLMGILDCDTMMLAKKELEGINPNIMIYGEGWSMPTAISADRCATQANYKSLPGIGFFNDDFRNTIKQLMMGHINCELEETVTRLLMGADYESATESLSYMSCHDDYTIYDEMYYGYEADNIVDRIKLGYAFILLGQGTPFIHSGCEALRTKEGIKNSYRSSEQINRLRWKNIESNKELVEYVKELIRVRAYISEKLCSNKEAMAEKLKVKVCSDYVKYTFENLTIYINLDLDKNKVEVEGSVISTDGRMSTIVGQDEKGYNNVVCFENYIVAI